MLSRLFAPTSTPPLPHHDFFETLIRRQYGRLAKRKEIYLDYTGGGLYADRQLEKHFARLGRDTFGNPHSVNPTSRRATSGVEATRRAVLDFFSAGDDYHCVFTANASAAIRTVGESYPWQPGGRYLLTADNHNSINGVREFARRGGADHHYAPLRADDLALDDDALDQALAAPSHGPKLFAYPAQSNVSGRKHDLGWIASAQARGWDVLLDAAAFVPTNRLDLSRYRPDFVCLSFYKMFGYPTGIGCLLIRKDSFDRLRKPWFAGGTVRLAAVGTPAHDLLAGHERFEDGTVNYLDLPAVRDGLDHLAAIGMDRLGERVEGLTVRLCDRLDALRHADGRPLVHRFGPRDRRGSGGTVIMNFRDARGHRIPWQTVEEAAAREGISLRSGCFCNPGIDEANYAIDPADLARYFSGPERGDYHHMNRALGKMRGCTRVSVGVATSERDLEVFVRFVDRVVRQLNGVEETTMVSTGDRSVRTSVTGSRGA